MIIRIRVIPNGEENEVVGRIGSVVRVKVVTPEATLGPGSLIYSPDPSS